MEQLIQKLNLLKEDRNFSDNEIQTLEKFIIEITPPTNPTGLLKLLSRNHVAKATDGKYTLKKYEKELSAKLDEHIDWYCGGDDNPTSEIRFDCYQLVKDASLMQIWTEVNTLSNDIFFTKSQIKSILENNQELFSNYYGYYFNFFYKKISEEYQFFDLKRFELKWVWGVEFSDRVKYAHNKHILLLPQ